MSIWLLANTVGEAAVQVQATDTSDSSSGVTQTLVASVRGGPRHLKWTAGHATAARRIAYINKDANLEADFCVIVDAEAHEDKSIKIIEFTAYGGTETTLTNPTISSSDFIGIASQDYLFQFSATESSKAAFAVEFSDTDYQKTARQIYFSKGIEFDAIPDGRNITLERQSIHNEPVLFHGNAYHLWALADLYVNCVTRANLDTYLELNTEQPVFLYDDSGSATIGTGIENKLWHCIILDEQVTPKQDDSHEIKFSLGILRNWA